MYCTRNITDQNTTNYDFAVIDNRGRRVGASILTYVMTFGERTTLSGWAWAEPGMVRFVAVTSATRNGNDYGASQSERFFSTTEDRDAYIAKYLRDAQKRAHKNGTAVNA